MDSSALIHFPCTESLQFPMGQVFSSPMERGFEQALGNSQTLGLALPEVEPIAATNFGETGERDDGLSAFASVRTRLFAIAYRMLGSATEADDIVQDVWLRWQSTNRSVVENPPAFLVTTTTRLCINLAQSAHSRRETCVGTWLTEPVDISGDPRIIAERHEALRLAVLVLLEKLSSRERAAYILREAFDYSYRQIAEMLQMEEPNTRQLVSRARKRISAGRSIPVTVYEQRRFLEAFIDAAQGDMAALEGIFAEDVVSARMAPGGISGVAHKRPDVELQNQMRVAS